MHQCVKCSKTYPDGSNELLKGCSCGGRFFFYSRKNLKDVKEEVVKLSKKDKEQIQQDVFDIVGGKLDDDNPVILDLESVKAIKPGKFEVDVVSLMKGKPVIFRMEKGKYIIDLASTFQQNKKNSG
ncbi:MAG: hypothetical protein CMH64_04505 [Nanoarchaeota archaeon]|nr:hypothetical protein [Nanoarchaeota archaeon]|tara:strand:- start:8474 stop:8851 length:378 start_codon:yes stop_codon:yes gene_type:complete